MRAYLTLAAKLGRWVWNAMAVGFLALMLTYYVLGTFPVADFSVRVEWLSTAATAYEHGPVTKQTRAIGRPTPTDADIIRIAPIASNPSPPRSRPEEE